MRLAWPGESSRFFFLRFFNIGAFFYLSRGTCRRVRRKLNENCCGPERERERAKGKKDKKWRGASEENTNKSREMKKGERKTEIKDGKTREKEKRTRAEAANERALKAAKGFRLRSRQGGFDSLSR